VRSKPIALVLCGLAVAACCAPATAETGAGDAAGRGAARDEETFDLDIPLIDGGVLKTDEMRGKLLVIDVWGTWCGPCRKVIPHLIEIQKRFGSQGVEVIGVSAEVSGPYETAVRRVKEFAAEAGINYQLGILNPPVYEKIKKLMRYEDDDFTVPSTFIVDRDGVIIGRYPGYFFGQEDEISDLLVRSLASEPAAAAAAEAP